MAKTLPAVLLDPALYMHCLNINIIKGCKEHIDQSKCIANSSLAEPFFRTATTAALSHWNCITFWRKSLPPLRMLRQLGQVLLSLCLIDANLLAIVIVKGSTTPGACSISLDGHLLGRAKWAFEGSFCHSRIAEMCATTTGQIENLCLNVYRNLAPLLLLLLHTSLKQMYG